MRALTLWLCLFLTVDEVSGLVPVDGTMRSFGVAIKAGSCKKGEEQTIFEHNVSAGAATTHGVISSMWHAGTRGDPRVRIYVDSEVGTDFAEVDYNVSLAHGLSTDDNGTYPWQSERFGHTHNMGWYNMYLIPFEHRVRVTLTCSVDSPFWFRLGGVENYPIAVGHLQLPPHAKLQIRKYDEVVPIQTLVTLANVTGTSGLLTQLNMWVRSTEPYQEGCVQATVDGRKLWLSSGLEDYFLGSYFHSMPQMSLGVTGFHLSNSTTCPLKKNGPNSLAAYRIHSLDPILFTDSLVYQWEPTNQHDHCNSQWPPVNGSSRPHQDEPAASTAAPDGTEVAITTYTYIYVY
jgi:hypothetical protein